MNNSKIADPNLDRLIVAKRAARQSRRALKANAKAAKQAARQSRRDRAELAVVRAFRLHEDDTNSPVIGIARLTADIIRLLRHSGANRSIWSPETEKQIGDNLPEVTEYVHALDRMAQDKIFGQLKRRTALLYRVAEDPMALLHLQMRCQLIIASEQGRGRITSQVAEAIQNVVGQIGDQETLAKLLEADRQDRQAKTAEQLKSYRVEDDPDGKIKVRQTNIAAPRRILWFQPKKGDEKVIGVFALKPDVDDLIIKAIELHLDPKKAPGRRVAFFRGRFDVELIEKGGQKAWLKSYTSGGLRPPIRLYGNSQPKKKKGRR